MAKGTLSTLASVRAKSVLPLPVGPMVEGPSDVYICANCVDLAHNIIRQEKRKLSSASTHSVGAIPA